MHEEYITFAVKAKAHVQLVQDALFSIESSLEKITANANKYVNIVRAELIRRALIHDCDKCREVNEIGGKMVPYRFAEYVVGTDYLYENEVFNLDFGSKQSLELHAEAYKGLTAREDHKNDNDHHAEHFGNYEQEMKLFPLIEMVCDWWGATVYTQHEPLGKFLKDSDTIVKRLNNLTAYQKFVIELTRNFIRDFIASHDTSNPDRRLIEYVIKGCKHFDKDSMPPVTSDTESQFYRELNVFLEDRIDLLNRAKDRRSKAWRTL